MAGLTLFTNDWSEESIRLVIRETGRTSFLLFSLAFGASSFLTLWRTWATKWLLRNRRYIGVSFSASHAIHAAALFALATTFPESFPRDVVTLLGGGLGYGFLAAMTATSSDAAVRWLGRRRWSALHKAGSYYL